MPSSDPSDAGPRPEGSNGYVGGALILLLVGALLIAVVARSGPAGRDLPMLPPYGGSAEELALLTANAPASLDPGVMAPAGEGPAYLLRGGDSSEVVAALSVALGFTAGSESRSNAQGFVVVDKGSDRILQVARAPGHPWNLTRGDPDCVGRPDATVSSDGTVSCPDSGVGSDEAGQVGGSPGSAGSFDPAGPSGESTEATRCEPVDCPEGQACAQVCAEPTPIAPVPEPVSAPIELPPPDRAEQRSREVLNAMGLEVARTTLTGAADGSGWQVLAEVAVGGLTAVGLDTHLVIGEDVEVVSGRGMLPDVELLGRYPLIDAEQALARLQANLGPRAGGPEPAVAVAPGTQPSSVVAMRLVLLLQSGLAGDRTGDYLVPAFLVDASDGAVFTVPAASDEYLAESSINPAPEPAPGPQPLSG